MNILYIGHYDTGSTSNMRGEYLKELLRPDVFVVANIDEPLQATTRIFRSFGWRFKAGPLIKNINRYISTVLNNNYAYDLVWVDKGVFILPSLVKQLRQQSKWLVHFTPDPAFAYHRSRLFYEALPLYDLCVTTKSYETETYRQNGARKIITCTQGFDPAVHHPVVPFEEKQGVVFIGHREDNREKILEGLLKKNISVTLAGIKWEPFAQRHKDNPKLRYLGKGIFGAAYTEAISGALLGLGFISRIVPELHTTRTFEIPASGTALVTERNAETEKIFNEGDVYFVNDDDAYLACIEEALDNKVKLKEITDRGYQRVITGGYDYRSILQKILKEISF